MAMHTISKNIYCKLLPHLLRALNIKNLVFDVNRLEIKTRTFSEECYAGQNKLGCKGTKNLSQCQGLCGKNRRKAPQVAVNRFPLRPGIPQRRERNATVDFPGHYPRLPFQ